MRSKRALVVGGGIGGLAAASVLARHFEQVILLEKDALAPATLGRKGVNQGSHLHSLLMGAQLLLEQLFPGFREELVAAGAVILRAGLDQQVFEAGRWMPTRDLGLTILAQTRGLLEREVRRRVTALERVSIRSPAKVTDVSWPDGGPVEVDVSIGSESERVTGDLLVDASGRGGSLLRLVEARAHVSVPVEEVTSQIAYVSGLLTKPPEFRERRENILIIPEPGRPAGGALLDVEGDRWIVSLHGRKGLTPPLELDAWKDYARELPDARIAERIAGASLDGKLTPYSKPISTFRRFDRELALPSTYVPLGDVMTSVNPIFGQGMALALGHAHILGEELAGGLDGLRPRYLARASAWSARAWRRASAYDRMFAIEGEKQLRDLRALMALAAARSEQAERDPAVHRALMLEGQMMPAWVHP